MIERICHSDYLHIQTICVDLKFANLFAKFHHNTVRNAMFELNYVRFFGNLLLLFLHVL